ncbi:MAG: universal stress protein [Chloroflexi bacterium]|nr:universal stress protein [Chloroflexota bacterium]MQC26181.1 universal stress protein [Chloroflexota bacterium]
MKTILAPTRGGERSFPNQDYAIRLAKERGAKLLFLNVNDIQFLNMVASPIAVDIATDELEEMGEFLVTLAKERAAKQGLEVETLVKNGVFRAVLEDVIQQKNVEILAMGTSSEQTGVTTKDYMRDLGRQLGETFGIEVILLYNGEAL